MPKKARKGGGGKGGGKTEERRLLYLQQRAQAEEEIAKKKEEILTLFLKDKLQKEEKNTTINLLKLNEGWRSILRRTRAAELRKDITILSQTFERQLDGLDSIIKTLEHDLQEVERQSAQVRRIHLQHMERLWAQQDKRLTVLQQHWENGLRHLSSRLNSERRQMSSQSQQQQAYLEDAAFAVERQHQELMNEIHRLYSESIASYQSAHKERTAALVLEEKERLKEKTLRNQEVLQLCSKQTKELDDLVARNRHQVQMTDQVMKKVKELQDHVIHLRAELNSSRTEAEEVERDLTTTNNRVNRKTHELRGQLTQGQVAARKQLTNLTMQSDSAAKKLRAVVAKGERVLRLAEMCRKLESEHETVVTPLSSAADAQRSVNEEEELAEEAPVFTELQRATRRVNAALLHQEALRKQREDLSRENLQLRLLLRQHLDVVTVSDRPLDGRHALLTVQQVPTTMVRPGVDRHHTVSEAVHAAKHSL